jgi:hypothetical protein
MAIRIQCVWRMIRAIRTADHKRGVQRSMRILGHNMMRFMQKIKARRIRHQQIKYGAVVQTIQRIARKYIGRNRLIERKHALRAAGEQREYGRCKTVNALCALQLRIVADSMTHDIGKKVSLLGSVECPMQGPVQSLFIAAVGSRARTELHALITNKLDSKNFSKFASRLENFGAGDNNNTATGQQGKGHAASGTGNSGDSSPKRRGVAGMNAITAPKERVPSRGASSAVLIEAIATNRFGMRKGTHSIGQTDMDLIFAETKEDPTEGSSLTYKEFVRCLDILANVHYRTHHQQPAQAPTGQKKKAMSKATKGKAAKGSAKASGSGEANSASADSVIPNRPKSPTARAASPELDLPTSSSSNPQHRFHHAKNLLAPLTLICGDNPHYGLMLALQLMSVHRNEKWMSGVNAFLDAEASQRLSVFVLRMQCMVRRRLARKRRRELELAREWAEAQKSFAVKVIKVQSIIRRYIGTRRCCRIAQVFIIKYVNHNGQIYYYNPSTRVSSWTKPSVLRELDCSTIPLPPTGLEVMVKCSNCGRDGQTSCVQCEDTFCNECFRSIHCKGNRRLHEGRQIPKCSYCKFQVATKNCLTCVLLKPVKGSAASYMKPSDRGRYCDPCFCHYHDEYEIELTQDANRKAALNEFIANTREAYIVRQFIQQKLRTAHRFEQLVQTCEECQWRCASWRCEDCNQIYCHKCLVGLHSINGPFQHHRAESLPYYTREMHASYQNDLEEQHLQQKLHQQLRTNRQQNDTQYLNTIIRIQSWWRGRYSARAGRQFLQQQRKRLRFAWRLRRREDKELRVGLGHMLRDWLGWNPQFSSDNREEAVLKTLNVFKRDAARQLILGNMEDWGWYRTSPTEPRKGVPRTGFDVGTVTELVDQAQRGGRRLPGRLILKAGESTHRTTDPLHEIVGVDQMLRIREHLYFIRSVDAESLTLDRRWFYGDMPAGELMYLMPSDTESKEGRRNRAQFRKQIFLLNNFVTQTGLSLHISSLRLRARYAVRMARTAKVAGAINDAIEWREHSKQYMTKANYLAQYQQRAKKKKGASAASRKSSKKLQIGDGIDERDYSGGNTSRPGSAAGSRPTSRPGSAVGSRPTSATAATGAAISAKFRKSRDSARLRADIEAEASREVDKVEEDAEKWEVDITEGNSMVQAKEKLEAEMSLPMHLRFGRKPGVPWEATPDEQIARRAEEATMTLEQLEAKAAEWEEHVNPLTDAIYYMNRITSERSLLVPSAMATVKRLADEAARTKAKVDEAKNTMLDLEKKSVKFSSTRRR